MAHNLSTLLHQFVYKCKSVTRTPIIRPYTLHRHSIACSSTMASVEMRYKTSSYDPELKKNCELIFRQGVEAVLPHKMISSHVRVNGNSMTVANRCYELSNNVYVVGFGKAVMGMAQYIDSILKGHIVRGVVNVPDGIRESYLHKGKQEFLLSSNSCIEIHEGAVDNLPDEAAFIGAKEIKRLVKNLSANDLLIVLISGGGSALSPAPYSAISLGDYADVTRLLGQHGATILELNTVRKNIDRLKGGGLARLAYPAKVLALIISDVIGDPMDIIASGPTVSDSSTAHQCLGYIRNLDLEAKMPKSVMQFLQNRSLQEAQKYEWSAQAKGVDLTAGESFSHVQNIIVGSSSVALEKCADTALELGYCVHILTKSLSGEARQAGVMMAHLAYYSALLHNHKLYHQTSAVNRSLIAAEMDLVRCGLNKEKIDDVIRTVNQAANIGKPICFLCGGETIVKVTGNGEGGRSQEMVLAMSLELERIAEKTLVKERYDVEFLSAGTDGQDSTTDAGGAFCDLTSVQRARKENLEPEVYLENNDSYTFYSRLSGGADHFRPGITGTNVMDISVLLVKPLKNLPLP